jgi:hypothetical protein
VWLEPNIQIASEKMAATDNLDVMSPQRMGRCFLEWRITAPAIIKAFTDIQTKLRNVDAHVQVFRLCKNCAV